MVSSFKKWLSEPLTRGLDLDDPKTTRLRKMVLKNKPFLRAIYTDWYLMLKDRLPDGDGAVLELGSGAGFAGEIFPQVISSEIFWVPEISLVLDGCALPFEDRSLKAIIMTDVLHHIPTVRSFFSEASRCLKPGGVLAMVEPWYTPWSGFIYRRFHHEPFLPEAAAWEFDTSGPLSGANGALPWMVFERDRKIFTQEFPSLQIETLRQFMPFSYLLSGGISLRTLAPARSYSFWRVIERLLARWSRNTGMFGFIVLRKIPDSQLLEAAEQDAAERRKHAPSNGQRGST